MYFVSGYPRIPLLIAFGVLIIYKLQKTVINKDGRENEAIILIYDDLPEKVGISGTAGVKVLWISRVWEDAVGWLTGSTQRQ